MGVQMREGQASVDAYRLARTLLLRTFTPFKGCTNLGRDNSPSVQSCELAGGSAVTVPAQGKWLERNFIVFAENVFGAPQPTEPFRALVLSSLVPAIVESNSTNQEVRAIGGAPKLVLWVQGIS